MNASPIISSGRISWKHVVSGWTVFWIYMGFQSYMLGIRYHHPVTWLDSFGSEALYAGLWCGLTPLIIAVARQFPLDNERWRKNILPHLPISIVVAFSHKVLFHFIDNAIAKGLAGSIAALATSPIFTYIDYGAMLYWVLILGYSANDYYHRLREESVRRAQVETQLAQAQLQALKMQLQPHFLFNTLNAISVLVEKDPPTARRMLSGLGDLLRLTLQKWETDSVPLRQELDFLERYLRIERMRFQDRLTVSIIASPDVLDAQVPAMLLQPLVENAMHHGVAQQRGAAEIRIAAGRLNGTLNLSVFDNGPGSPGALEEGIGLSNIRARLNQVYGNRSTFSASNAEGGGFLASISIPFATEQPTLS